MPVEVDFFNNPAAFLSANVVVQKSSNQPMHYAEGNLYYFVVREFPTAIVGNLANRKACYMTIVAATTPNAVQAYYCPYAPNDGRATQLGNAADYVFTPTMDGCTVGLGSYDGAGGRRMIHQNSANSGAALGTAEATPESRAQQRKMQSNIVRSKLHDLNAPLIEPTQYQTWDANGPIMGEIKTTTWGQHTANTDWTFFSASYILFGKNSYAFRGVRQVF